MCDMTETRSASQQIVDEVTSWPDVTAVSGSRGELSLRAGRRGDRPPARRSPRPLRLPEDGRRGAQGAGPHRTAPGLSRTRWRGAPADRLRRRHPRGDRPDAPELRGRGGGTLRRMSGVRGVLRTPPDDAWSLHRFDPGPRLAPYAALALDRGLGPARPRAAPPDDAAAPVQRTSWSRRAARGCTGRCASASSARWPVTAGPSGCASGRAACARCCARRCPRSATAGCPPPRCPASTATR